MSKKELFKEFVKQNPTFISYVDNNSTSWQKLYELYDLYGENDSVWEKYKKPIKETSDTGIKGILNSIKGINLDSFQENLTNIQKAVSFLEDVTAPSERKEKKKKNIKDNKPIDKFYSD